MSYRTYVNNIQIFGNNEYYAEWFDFLKKQGVEVDPDEFTYKGEITDVMGAVRTIEKIILRLAKPCNEKVISAQIAEQFITKKNMDDTIKKNILESASFKYNSMFDFSHRYEEIVIDDKDKYGLSLTDNVQLLIDHGYIFMSCAFLNACKDNIEPAPAGNKRLRNWKIKDGKTITIEAR